MSKIPHATNVLTMISSAGAVHSVDLFGARLEQTLLKTLGDANWLKANRLGAAGLPLPANQKLDDLTSISWTVEMPGEAPDALTRYAVQQTLMGRGYSRVLFRQTTGVVNRTHITVSIDFPPLH